MANEKLHVVSIEKLEEYNTLIKNYIGDEITDAVDALDTAQDVTIASKSGNAVTIAGSISETDGIVGAGAASNITLADVASTGAAEDVSYDNISSGLTATDIQAAVDELAEASAGGVASKTVYLTDDSAGQSAYAKVYNLYQGSDSSDMTKNTLVGTLNIPKDKVVEDGSVVDITFSENKLWDGETDVTALIKGSGTPTAADAGKYIKLVLQNVTDPLYIAANDLVDVYTGGTTAEATVTVNGGIITVTINTIDGSKIIYKAETSAGAGDGETVKQALTRLDGADTVTGSVSKKVKDAIDALDTQSDVTIASVSSNVVTIAAGVKEVDGVIAAGTGTAITLEEVAYTGAASDVSYSNTIAGTSVTDVDSALDALTTTVGDGVEECTTAEIEALFD